MDTTTKPYLKHKKTGDVFPYTAVLAKRPDMEPVDEAPPPVQPLAPPLKARAQAPTVVVAPAISEAEIVKLIDEAVQPLTVRLRAIEAGLAMLKSAAAADTAPKRRGRSSAPHPDDSATVQRAPEDAAASPPVMPGFENLMRHSQSAAAGSSE